MNVIYINSNPRNKLSDVAGYATHMAKTIKGLESAGHPVTRVIAGDNTDISSARRRYRMVSSAIGLTVGRLARDFYDIYDDRCSYRRLLRKFSKGEYDFVYERMNPYRVCGARLAHRLRIPFALEINDPLEQSVTIELSFIRRYAYRLERHLIDQAALVVLGSTALKQSYRRRGVDAEKLLVLYPTADLDLFDPTSSLTNVRQQLGIEKKIVVGFVAGKVDDQWRRLDILISSMQAITQDRADVVCLMVGNEDVVPSARLDSIFYRTGAIPYELVPSYIGAMDVCVIPNATWYGSPTKLFEYGAMGKAVVAPRFAPIEEVLEDGTTGLLFEQGSAEGLRMQIMRLVEDSNLRSRLGSALRWRIQERYTWSKNTSALIEAIRQIRSDGMALSGRTARPSTFEKG